MQAVQKEIVSKMLKYDKETRKETFQKYTGDHLHVCCLTNKCMWFNYKKIRKIVGLFTLQNYYLITL